MCLLTLQAPIQQNDQTLKQLVGFCWRSFCVLDHFVGLALKGLTWLKKTKRSINTKTKYLLLIADAYPWHRLLVWEKHVNSQGFCCEILQYNWTILLYFQRREFYHFQKFLNPKISNTLKYLLKGCLEDKVPLNTWGLKFWKR